jgi:Heterokaryon incompatibility protein (HET)
MSTSNPEPCVYDSLRSGSDEIRLITIEPSSKIPHEICCSIETVELSTAPQYYALSYVWGDPNMTEEIRLGGRAFHVTTNLAAALRRLRILMEDVPKGENNTNKKEPTRLWIDAICINQSSVLEKNQQIPLMGRIYSLSEGVVMWLGEGENDSQLAVSFVKNWYDSIIAAIESYSDEYRSNPLKTTLSFIKDPFHSPSIQALALLLERGYWDRIWIIQEIVLAKSRLILCGGDAINLDALFTVLLFWRNSLSMPKADDQQIMNHLITLGTSLGYRAEISDLIILVRNRTEEEKRVRPYKQDILSLIRIGFNRSCTDPRDRLYGFFGLMEDEQLPMHPDYRLTHNEVKLSFTVGLIQTSNRLESVALSGFGFGPPTSIDFPTWVPEYKRSSSHKHDFAQDFVAAADSKAECTFENLPLLHARGIICGEILEICHSENDNLLLDEEQRWVWEWLALANPDSESVESCHPTRVPWRQVFFRTLAGGRLEEYSESDLHGRAEGFITFMRCCALRFVVSSCGFETTKNLGQLLQTDMLPVLDIGRLVEQEQIDKEVAYWLGNSSVTEDRSIRDQLLDEFCGGLAESNIWPHNEYGYDIQSQNFNNFLRYAMVATAGRSFFMTIDGYTGLAPRFAEKGDLICILLGCSVPMIIRKWGVNYVVVGDAYIYGMMKGEMMEDVEKGRLHVQNLTFQ